MQPLLTIQDLSAGYGGKTVIRDISLTLMPGEILGVVGESGSGETTLLKAVSEVKGLRTDIYTGTVTFNGEDLLHMEAEEKRKRQGEEIAYVFQHPGDSLNPTRKVRVQFYETILAHRRMEKKEMDELIASVFKRIGLTDVELLHPKLILADEPTSALDTTVQKQVLEELLMLRNTLHTAMIIITHNIGVARHLADRVAVLYKGEIVEMGKTKEVLENPQHPYTKSLMAAVPKLAYAMEKEA